jgi:hypothetical protein
MSLYIYKYDKYLFFLILTLPDPAHLRVNHSESSDKVTHSKRFCSLGHHLAETVNTE